MIYLLTGTPGHGKTQRALWMLLNDKRFKGRPVLHANVRGLKLDDERISHWLPLTDVQQWETAPQGSVIFIDECHQAGFFPLRGVGKPPHWIEQIATHRHLGLDFVLVTQNAKNMDVFVRRMVELHMHCKRPAQMGYTNVYEFQSFVDCDDRVPVTDALRHSRWQLDKGIWTLYESADEHTAKAKPPRLLYALPFLLAALVAAGWYAWHWGQEKQKAKPPVLPVTATSIAPAAPLKLAVGSETSFSLSRLTPQARVEYVMHETRDWAYERQPLNPDYPESAPLYDELRAVKSFPRVAGCAVSRGECRCVDQQGTPARITVASCFDFVINGRFDPYRDEKQSRELGERSLAAAAPAPTSGTKADNCAPYLVYGIGGSVSTETRCPSHSAPATQVPMLPTGPTGATSANGLSGQQAPIPGVPDIERGGYVKR